MPIRIKKRSRHKYKKSTSIKSKRKNRSKKRSKRRSRRSLSYTGAGPTGMAKPVTTVVPITTVIPQPQPQTQTQITGQQKTPYIRPKHAPPTAEFNIMRDTLHSQIDPTYRRMGNVFRLICNNSDNCLALGPYGDVLKDYFTNFTDLSLIRNNSLKRIGSDSANGFIIEIPFTKGGYTAYTALKCSTGVTSDNLFYEYYIGHNYINTHIAYLPCFVETYGCYSFKDSEKWVLALACAVDTHHMFECNLQSMIEPFSVDTNPILGQTLINLLGNSCSRNKLLCVLIQHFDNVRSFNSEISTHPENITVDFYNLLYQIYYGLTLLGNTYTHYDLHGNNVLLYKPYEGEQYITMRYHRNGHIYEFKTEYICKIIDYGRNFMQQQSTPTTTYTTSNIINLMCKQPTCNPNCGSEFGYNFIQGNVFNPDRPPADTGYILPNIPNMSHDLRLIYKYKSLLTAPEVTPYVKVCDDITYISKSGTPENMTGNIDHITNIFHLRDALERVMGNETVAGFNAMHNDRKYATWTQAAIMNIYDDNIHSENRRPYTYTII